MYYMNYEELHLMHKNKRDIQVTDTEKLRKLI